ncbi:MAG TPA: PASTA domain-containing protein, partial [Vicinamibacterales bacterium]|nr:PASTA domain-containing protein [Vicinamibacterales bacterium]
GSGQSAQNVYAVDVDACSGTPSERLWLDHDPKTGAVIGGPFTVAIDNLVALGRWRFRPSARDEAFLPPVRMLMARNTSLAAVDRPVIVTPNGLRAGEYTAPIFEYIFPEANPPGGAPPPPNPFENFPFLVSGEGPYNGGAVTGQLSPWPGLVPPVSTVTCAAPPPPPPTTPPAGTPAPIAAADALSITGSSLTFSAAQLLANDSGSGISLSAVSPVSVGGGTITGSGPFVFTPAATFTTSDSFSYEIADSFGQTALGFVTVTRAATVAVPNVVGQTQANATSSLTAAGLQAGAITSANSATVAAGSVISQSPVAGVSVATGSPVALVISLGPALVTVPNVVNLTQANAQSAIVGAGLTAGGITNANSNTVAAGSVISQNPAGGASVAPGTAVALVISSGPALVTVPNVVALTQANAQSAITAAGLTTGTVTTASSATVPAGSVISQNPPAGATAPFGSAVALVVSSGAAVANPAVDATVSSDGTGARTTPAFSTTAAGDVLIALVGSDGPSTGANNQNITVSGAGLTWTRVQRAATSRGVSEIWTATAAAVLTNVTVTSTQSVPTILGAPVNQSVVVVAFKNASAVGATAAASNVSTNANASLVPQATGSVVYGVGNDFDRAVSRTVGAGQTKIHEFLAPTGDTFWMQSLNANTTAGTSVTLNATAAGVADQWNFAIVEIKR